MTGEKFLHTKDTNLQKSDVVELSVAKHNRLNNFKRNELLESAPTDSESEAIKNELEALKKTPNTPEARIDVYLKRLEKIFLNADKISEGTDNEVSKGRRNLELLKPYIYDEFTLKEGNIPESYWNLQRKVAKEEGRDFPEEISDSQKQDAFEKISKDQKHSLDHWLHYLTGPDAFYPAWFKFFAMKSVFGLAEYDKKQQTFPKRTKSTTGIFPDLNAEALVYVHEFLEKQLKNEAIENPIPEPNNPHAHEVKPVSDEAFQKIISSENFAKYYGFTLEHMTSQSELWPVTDGEWQTFKKGEEALLVKSLQGKGTGWCTAGIGMAETQLSYGVFHVYYSLDKLGQPTIPRLAIRMDGETIAEVRGVDADQNIDPYISPVLEDKLPSFGKQGEEYLKRTADMTQLTEIDTKVKSNQELSPEDLRFLYEIDDKIVSFRQQGQDPRIEEIKNQRDWLQDIQKIFATNSEDEIALNLITTEKSTNLLLENLNKFSSLSSVIAMFLIANDTGYQVIKNWGSFKNLNETKVIETLIKHNQDRLVIDNLDKFTAISQQEVIDKIIKSGTGVNVARKLEAFTEIGQKEIYNQLFEAGEFESIIENLYRFTEIESKKVALDVTKANKIELVLQNYSKFGALDNQYFAEMAVALGRVGDLAAELDKFESIQGEAVFNKLLSHGFGDAAAEYLHIFTDIDKQDAVERLIELEQVTGILRNIEYFKDITLDMEAIGKIFTQNSLENDDVQAEIALFPEEFQLEYANKFISDEKGSEVTTSIRRFNKTLHKKITLLLLNHLEKEPESMEYEFRKLFYSLGGYSEIDSEVANKLVEVGEASRVLRHISKFTDLDHQRLIDGIEISEVARHIADLKNISQETFAKLLITPAKDSGGRGVNFDYLLRNIDNFIITDHQSVAETLIELKQIDKLGEYLHKFKNLSPDIAKQLLPLNGHLVAKNMDTFPGIDQQEIADGLIALNKGKYVAQNLSHFTAISQATLEKVITKDTQSEVVSALQYFEIERFNQDSLAAKLIETSPNIYFSGIRALDKYQSLTNEQLNTLNAVPPERQAAVAKEMVEQA